MTAATAIRTSSTDDCVPPSWRSNAIQSRHPGSDDERDPGDHDGRPEREREPPPFAANREPQEADARRDVVSSTNAQVPAQRNPSTIAAANRRWICPIRISWLTGSASTSSAAGQGARATRDRRQEHRPAHREHLARYSAEHREDLGERGRVEIRVDAADGRAGVLIRLTSTPSR